MLRTTHISHVLAGIKQFHELKQRLSGWLKSDGTALKAVGPDRGGMTSPRAPAPAEAGEEPHAAAETTTTAVDDAQDVTESADAADGPEKPSKEDTMDKLERVSAGSGKGELRPADRTSSATSAGACPSPARCLLSCSVCWTL